MPSLYGRAKRPFEAYLHIGYRWRILGLVFANEI